MFATLARASASICFEYLVTLVTNALAIVTPIRRGVERLRVFAGV